MNTNSDNDFSIKSLMQSDPIIKSHPSYLKTVEAIFEFTQYLLDDDENLTKSGNLTSKAKTMLDDRILEIFETKDFGEEEDEE